MQITKQISSFPGYYVTSAGNKHPTSKPVQQIKNSQILAEFNSEREAQNKTGISQGCISMCCAGKYKTAGGYQWRHK